MRVNTVKAASVRGWLSRLEELSDGDLDAPEIYRLTMFVTKFLQDAGAAAPYLEEDARDPSKTVWGTALLPSFDWENGEIDFSPRDGYTRREIELLLARTAEITETQV